MNNLFHVILIYIWIGNAFGGFFPFTELFCWVKQALSAAPEVWIYLVHVNKAWALIRTLLFGLG